MAAHTVKSATPAEIADVADLLTLAFSTDPAARWSWADPRVYLASFPRFVRAFGGAAFQSGTAHVAEGNKGAALWLPPGAEPDEEAMGVLMQETVPPHIGKDGIAVMQQMANYHPSEPHWYLPLIGIDPMHQGKGLGGSTLHNQNLCKRTDDAILSHWVERYGLDGWSPREMAPLFDEVWRTP